MTLHLAGLKPPAPTTGCKRSYASEICEHLGITQPPSRGVLVEPGEWGRTLDVLLGPWITKRDQVADQLIDWAPFRDRDLFDIIRNNPPDKRIDERPFSLDSLRAAKHLFLQSRTFRGKPVYPKADGTGWVTYGFDPEFRLSPNRAAGSKDRGFYNARPVLAEKIRKLIPPFPIQVRNCTADLVTLGPAEPGDVVYIDPPYQGSGVEYLHKLPRAEVVLLARLYARNGYTVGVSEAEPVEELLTSGGTASGWKAVKLKPYRGGVTFNKREEWLTIRKS